MNNVNLSGKVIIVTGGSMGIGYACAEACKKAGARLLICARGQGDLVRAEKKLEVPSMVIDVADELQVKKLFESVLSKFGKVDGVIHSAGIYGPIGPVLDVASAEWLNTIHINLFGSFLVTKYACDAMKRSGGGRIVLLSGGGAATPFPNYTAYACSKIGVVRLVETVAKEVKDCGIEINCLAPGFVVTRLHQQTLTAGQKAGSFLQSTMKQIESGGVSADVAASAASFLLSDLAKGITGKFVAAPYDEWHKWPERLSAIEESDLFTLRRIVPKDRGQDWQ